MAEVVAAVVGTTNNVLGMALTCFELVQIARSFDDDLNTHRIKLDIIQLRLSRWGEAAGLDGDSSSNPSAPQDDCGDEMDIDPATKTTPSPLTASKHEEAQRLLRLIESQFTTANGQVENMQPQNIIDPARDLSLPMLTLRTKLREALRRRQAALVKTTHKVKWAFYKKKKFDEFVTNLSKNIRELEALFPIEEGAKTRLHELGAFDCSGLDKTCLQVLGTVTKECDPYLDAAVVDALKAYEPARSGTNATVNNHGSNSGQQIAHMEGDQSGITFQTTHNNNKS